MSEWIKCCEKYPEDGQQVIFYNKDRDLCFCGFFEKIPRHIRILEGENVFFENLDNWWFADENITHWMPLSSPDIS